MHSSSKQQRSQTPHLSWQLSQQQRQHQQSLDMMQLDSQAAGVVASGLGMHAVVVGGAAHAAQVVAAPPLQQQQQLMMT
jgi:hypothetical protein